MPWLDTSSGAVKPFDGSMAVVRAADTCCPVAVFGSSPSSSRNHLQKHECPSAASIVVQKTSSKLKMDVDEFFTEYGEANRYQIREVIGKGSYGVVCSGELVHCSFIACSVRNMTNV
jgi:hypothetical protein